MSTYAVVNPATGEKVKEYEEISDVDLDAAIARADAAYRSWTTSTNAAERARLIRRVADLYDERADELAAIIAREMGKPLPEGKGEALSVASISTAHYADQGPGPCSPTPRWTPPAMGGSAVVRKESARPRCSVSCRGTSRTTRWPGSRRPT